MLFFEEYARLGLVLHLIIACALVASSTHLVLWMRNYPKGRYTRVRAARRFALITCSLYALTLLLGNLLYPTYKVRVRVGFLDDGSAVVRDSAARTKSAEETRRRYQAGREVSAGIDSPVPETELAGDPAELARANKKAARWFDVKEHWAALGFILALGCAVLLFSWRPKEHPPVVPIFAFVLATAVVFITWSSAIIGVWVSSIRSVG